MEIEETISEYREDHDMEELVEPLYEKNSHNRKLAWARELLQDAKRYGAPYGTFRESKRPRPYSSYVALLCDIIDEEPYTMMNQHKIRNGRIP